MICVSQTHFSHFQETFFMHPKKCSVFLGPLVAVFSAFSVHADIINISGKLFSEAGPQANTSNFYHWGKQTFTAPQDNFSAVSTTITEYASCSNTYDFLIDNENDYGYFKLTAQQSVSGHIEPVYRAYSLYYEAVSFTITDPVTYTIEGFWDLDGVAKIDAYVNLTNWSVNQFSNSQISENTPDEYFVAGGTGGDYHSYSEGPLTGTLEAGTYELRSWGRITTTGTSASASSSIAIYFNQAPVEEVPEPSVLLFMLTGLGSVLALKKRKQR